MGIAVGISVGVKVTSCTPAPATTAVPEQVVAPRQPSWIRYVCDAAPAGTVYCTCAHTLPPSMHCAGGFPLPVPVSSYATSTPAAVKTRSEVDPKQEAPGNCAPHMLTVNVCPAVAATPHMASFTVSELVLPVRKGPHRLEDVGRRVGNAEGAGDGAVGLAVGGGLGSFDASVGLAVGSAEGFGVGVAVVGCNVGRTDGTTVGLAIGNMVGFGEGAAVGLAVGQLVGEGVGGG